MVIRTTRFSRGGTAAAATALVLIATIVSARSARVEDPRGMRVFLTQQDAVQAFDLSTGKGYQIGTATGMISGTTFVEFQFVPTGPPVGDALPIAFQNKVIITDLDGDQILFDNEGTGSFHLGIAGTDFRGSGGPLIGTYVVTGATGKYRGWKVGSKYKYRAVVTHPPSPPARLGNVYVEVSFRNRGHQ